MGFSLRCLVSTSHEPSTRRECDWFRQSSQSSYCKTGRFSRSLLVSKVCLSRFRLKKSLNSMSLKFQCRDGALKRMNAKKEWKQKQQEEFSKRLKVEWLSDVRFSVKWMLWGMKFVLCLVHFFLRILCYDGNLMNQVPNVSGIAPVVFLWVVAGPLFHVMRWNGVNALSL